MGKARPCKVCYSLANEDLIETCSKCDTRAHLYCMPKDCRSLEDDWVCDSCKPAKDNICPEPGRKKDRSDDHPAGASGVVVDDSKRKTYSRKQKPVGKVKFLPNEEAIRLSSVVRTMKPQRSFYSKLTQSNSMAPPRSPSQPKSGTPKSPLSLIISNPSITDKSLRHERNIKMHMISNLMQKTSPVPKDPGEPKASLAHNAKKHDSSGPVVTEISRTKEVRPSKLSIPNVKATRTKYKDPDICKNMSLDTPCINRPGRNLRADAKPRKSVIEGPVLANHLPKPGKNIPSDPYLDATWCGSLEILETDSCSEFYDGFQAHISWEVHRKAQALSKIMPSVLQCTLLPCCNVWKNVFQNQSPTVNDMALFFAPGNFERSRQQYFQLLELLEIRDVALRSRVNGVSLLILSSKRLNMDFHELEMEPFLWGVFCSKPASW